MLRRPFGSSFFIIGHKNISKILGGDTGQKSGLGATAQDPEGFFETEAFNPDHRPSVAAEESEKIKAGVLGRSPE